MISGYVCLNCEAPTASSNPHAYLSQAGTKSSYLLLLGHPLTITIHQNIVLYMHSSPIHILPARHEAPSTRCAPQAPMVSGAGIIAKGDVVAQQQPFPSPTGIGRELKTEDTYLLWHISEEWEDLFSLVFSFIEDISIFIFIFYFLYSISIYN